jgi:hypothetical protein
MDESRKSLDELYKLLDTPNELKQDELASPDPIYDKAVRNIYKQAHKHRDRLVGFYITYISCFTICVFTLLLAQAIVRVMTHDSKFEIMPQWTFDILVTGMFVQFIGLLKIVTENVWNFKPFFDHHNEMRNSNGKDKTDDEV